MKTYLLSVLVVFLSCLPARAGDVDIVSLPPAWVGDWTDIKQSLPKPVYQSPTERRVLMGNNELLLMHYARVYGGLGISNSNPAEEMRRAKKIVDMVGAKLTYTTRPWKDQLPKLPKGVSGDPMDWTRTTEEVEWHVLKLHRLIERRMYKSLDAVILEMERYKEPDIVVTARANLLWAVTRHMLPSTPIHWYRNGDWAPMADVQNESRTCALYRPHQMPRHEEWFDAMAEHYPDDRFGIWITFAGCYQKNPETNREFFDAKDCPMTPRDYYWLGRWFASDDRIDFAIVWPGAYRMNLEGVDVSLEETHRRMIAFARGATGMGAE